MSIIVADDFVFTEADTSLTADHPIVGWDSLVTPSNVEADTSDADFPASNLANPATHLKWAADDTTEQYVTVTTGTVDDIDYLGIARHNLGTAGIAVSVEGTDGVEVTNLLLQSQTLDNAAWFKADTTVSANATTAQDGTATADKLIEAATTTWHILYNTAAMPVTSGQAYTASVYLKAAERTWAFVSCATNGIECGVFINLATGALGTQVGSPSSVSVTSEGNGWYRVSATRTATASNSTGYTEVYCATGNGASLPSYLGDVTKGIYVWGGQFEAGSSAGGYVPTTTVPATDIPFTEITSPVTPDDDSPILFRFTPQELAIIRLKLAAGTAAASIAVMYVGKLLVLPRKLYQGLTPTPHARVSKATNGRSEAGNYLGRVITQEFVQGKIPLSLITPAYYRTNIDPFIAASNDTPFFFGWRPETYADDLGYCFMTNDPMPVNESPHGLIALTLEMTGVV